MQRRGQREAPPLHPEGHEAGAQHCNSEIHVQVRHRDVRLPTETETMRISDMLLSSKEAALSL